jgi:phosphoribosylaminoimidazole carboxylase (NCAIR synthetase)
MLAEAAADLGVALHVQCPGADDPAVGLAASRIDAAVDDPAAPGGGGIGNGRGRRRAR